MKKEIQDTIHNQKPKNSAGIDNFSTNMIKQCKEELTVPLVSIVKSFQNGNFPLPQKLVKFIPNIKKVHPLK